MPTNHVALFVHLIWRTWDALPLIDPSIEQRIHRLISTEAARLGCDVLAVNGTVDHVHVFVRIPTTLPIATLVRQLKGVSARRINEAGDLRRSLRWQGHYAAFSVSRWDIQRITAYIRTQKAHHAAGAANAAGVTDDALDFTDGEIRAPPMPQSPHAPPPSPRPPLCPRAARRP